MRCADWIQNGLWSRGPVYPEHELALHMTSLIPHFLFFFIAAPSLI